MEKKSVRLRNQYRIFHYEKELKKTLRRQLERLEPGLIEVDGGKQRQVASGNIDITARDSNGHFVVIELKVGPCPSGALEQVLGYSADLEAETGTPCRAVLVAAEFSSRMRSAASRARDINLLTYQVEGVEMGATGFA